MYMYARVCVCVCSTNGVLGFFYTGLFAIIVMRRARKATVSSSHSSDVPRAFPAYIPLGRPPFVSFLAYRQGRI